MLGTAAVGSAAVGLGAVAAVPAGAQAPAPQVILYGDSISAQVEPYFNQFASDAGRATVVDHVYPGTAPCNWLPQMLADASSGTTAVAVLQFSGDDFGCESEPVGTPAYYQTYQQQVTEAAQAFAAAGAHTFLIGYPISFSEVETQEADWDELNQVYAGIAASVPDTTFVNAGASVEADGGRFAWTLPCLSGEPYCGPGGKNVVREDDGGHFCPLDPNDGVNCGDYASGSIRFAEAMARPVTQFLTAGSAPDYEGPALPAAGTLPEMAPGQVDPYVDLYDELGWGASLASVGSLESLDHRYTVRLQRDGNLVLYGPHGSVWSTGTAGSGADSLVMQTDGNVVLSGRRGVVWSSGTADTGSFVLCLQDDGQLVLYNAHGPTWSSGPPATPGA